MLAEGPQTKGEGSRDVLLPAIVENMRDGVIAFDSRGTVIAVNGPARDILGLKGEVCVGSSFAELVLPRSDLADVNDVIVDAMYAANNMLTRDITIGHGDDERHIVIRTSMLFDERQQRALGVIAMLSDVSEKVRGLRERIEFGHMVVLYIATLALANIITLVVQTYRWFDVYSNGFAWAYILLIAMPVAYTAWLVRLKPSAVGLRLEGWRRATLEGLGASVIAVALLYGLSLLLPVDPAKAAPPSVTTVILIQISYMAHSFVQEVLARGVLQTSLRRLLDDESGLRSLIVASLIFGLFHSHFGLAAVGVTALSGMLFGALYIRHGNLIGVSILHGIAGAAAFALGFI